MGDFSKSDQRLNLIGHYNEFGNLIWVSPSVPRPVGSVIQAPATLPTGRDTDIILPGLIHRRFHGVNRRLRVLNEKKPGYTTVIVSIPALDQREKAR
ncbi:MAG TPA: hypothetical protein VFY40_17520, partial [Blastocatellia bacterium]|nr:hypothetical protein [Blastocatellia bacterium]